MHENSFNNSYRIPSGMLIVFLEKALTLIHMETHLDDVSTSIQCPRFSLAPSQAHCNFLGANWVDFVSNLSLLVRTHFQLAPGPLVIKLAIVLTRYL